jgi:hypothetical protein
MNAEPAWDVVDDERGECQERANDGEPTYYNRGILTVVWPARHLTTIDIAVPVPHHNGKLKAVKGDCHATRRTMHKSRLPGLPEGMTVMDTHREMPCPAYRRP